METQIAGRLLSPMVGASVSKEHPAVTLPSHFCNAERESESKHTRLLHFPFMQYFFFFFFFCRQASREQDGCGRLWEAKQVNCTRRLQVSVRVADGVRSFMCSPVDPGLWGKKKKVTRFELSTVMTP